MSHHNGHSKIPPMATQPIAAPGPIPAMNLDVVNRRLTVPCWNGHIGWSAISLTMNQVKAIAAQWALLEVKDIENAVAISQGQAPPHEMPEGWPQTNAGGSQIPAPPKILIPGMVPPSDIMRRFGR